MRANKTHSVDHGIEILLRRQEQLEQVSEDPDAGLGHRRHLADGPENILFCFAKFFSFQTVFS